MIDFIKNGSVHGAKYGTRARAPAACPASGRCSPTSRSKRSSSTCGACDVGRAARRSTGSPSSAASSPSSSASAVLMGSVYLVIATNLGARLGFLVALTGLFGWLALMGGIWWIYGIGYKGAAPEWKEVPGQDGHPGGRPAVRSGSARRAVPVHGPGRLGAGRRRARHAASRAKAGAGRRVGARVRAGRSRRRRCSSRRRRRSPRATSTSPPSTRSAARRTRSRSAIRSTSSRSGTTRTTRWSRSLRSRRPATEPGRAPTRTPRSTPPSSASTCTWSATSVARASRRRSSASARRIIFLALCWLLHRRDRYVAANLSAEGARRGLIARR